MAAKGSSSSNGNGTAFRQNNKYWERVTPMEFEYQTPSGHTREIRVFDDRTVGNAIHVQFVGRKIATFDFEGVTGLEELRNDLSDVLDLLKRETQEVRLP